MFNCCSIVANNLKTITHDTRWITTTASLLKSYYDVLGLTKNCTQSQIKEAFFKLSKIYHPDRNDSVEAVEKFREINDAYEVLKNLKLRRLYDKGQLHTAGRQYANDAASYSSDPDEWQHNNDQGKFYKQRTKQERPKGRTAHYDYEEWERAHYGELFRRRQNAKVRWENIQWEKSTDLRRRRDISKMMYVMLTGIAFYLVIITLDINDYDRPRQIQSKDKES